MMRRQNKLYKKYKKNGFNIDDKERVDKFREEFLMAINMSKQNYLNDLGIKLTDKTLGKKSYWKIVNNLMNKCKILRIPPLLVGDKFITTCKEKATLFNDYFLLQCKPIQNSSALPVFSYITNSTLETVDFDRQSILTLINALNENKAYGADLISVQMILPLQIIFTYIIAKGILPEQWKMANVTPVHKKKKTQIIKHYRPISLLPIFAKLFEKMLFLKMYNYFIANNLITKNQSGFRPNDSVTNQLISLVESIHSAFDINHEIRSVYLDMSKAFDKVWHEGLIFKLKQNGIKGKLLNLFESYLSNRKQRVMINGSESDWGIIESGVPKAPFWVHCYF